jgi:acyl carrier protein
MRVSPSRSRVLAADNARSPTPTRCQKKDKAIEIDRFSSRFSSLCGCAILFYLYAALVKANMDKSVSEIREVVFGTLRTTLRNPVELTDQTNIANDLGLDSVAVMDFVMEIEDQLNVSVPLDRIAEVQTLGDLVETLHNVLSNP